MEFINQRNPSFAIFETGVEFFVSDDSVGCHGWPLRKFHFSSGGAGAGAGGFEQ